MPLPVSVQVCTLNEEANIGDCLALIQANDPEEVVVIDGGSTDRTVDIAAEMGARILSPGRLGLGPSRQLGWNSTDCPYVAFVDADDRLPPGWLAEMLHQLREGEYDALQSLLGAHLDGSWWSRAWDQYFRASISSAATSRMVGRPALLVADSLREFTSPLPSLDEDTHLSRWFEQRAMKQGVGTAFATRRVEAGFLKNFRKWQSYGRGYCRFVEQHPERRSAMLRHVLWTIPIKRSWPSMLRGHVRQPIFGALMALSIASGWFNEKVGG